MKDFVSCHCARSVLQTDRANKKEEGIKVKLKSVSNKDKTEINKEIARGQ